MSLFRAWFQYSFGFVFEDTGHTRVLNLAIGGRRQMCIRERSCTGPMGRGGGATFHRAWLRGRSRRRRAGTTGRGRGPTARAGPRRRGAGPRAAPEGERAVVALPLIHTSEPTRLRRIFYAVICLIKKHLTGIRTPINWPSTRPVSTPLDLSPIPLPGRTDQYYTW